MCELTDKGKLTFPYTIKFGNMDTAEIGEEDSSCLKHVPVKDDGG